MFSELEFKLDCWYLVIICCFVVFSLFHIAMCVIIHCYVGTSINGRLPLWYACLVNHLLSHSLPVARAHVQLLTYYSRLVILNVVMKQVCTSGLVSFGSSITNSSGSIPRSSGPPIIAAHWTYFRTYSYATYNKGRVYYRHASAGTTVVKITYYFLHFVVM